MAKPTTYVILLIVFIIIILLFGIGYFIIKQNSFPIDVITPDQSDKDDTADLSLFIYPSWEDYEMNQHEIEFDINRDLGAGTKRVFAEFLHITDPIMELPNAMYDGVPVGVGIVEAGENHFGPLVENAYSPEFAKLMREKVAEPFVTLSGRGHWRRLQGRSNDPNMAYLMNQSENYRQKTADFIVHFVRNVCCFKGININIERNVLLTDLELNNYVKWLEYLVDKAHEGGLQVIFTTITQVAPFDFGDGEGYVPRIVPENFPHSMIYHIPFDYINYMTIDQFWMSGDKTLGHYDYASLKKYLDHAKIEDPKFQERTIVQLSNYTVWGYNQGFFDNNGIIISDEDRINFVNQGDPVPLAWQFQIITQPKLLRLLKGDDSWLWRAWTGKNDDVLWDESAGYSLDQGFRLPASGEKVIVLGKGFVNRREYDVEDGEFPSGAAVGNEVVPQETVVIIPDEYSISKKAEWVFNNYGLNRFSMWHGGRDMPWFSDEVINEINYGRGIPVFVIDNKCPTS